jgi:Cys-tRNA(Pro) deacylase
VAGRESDDPKIAHIVETGRRLGIDVTPHTFASGTRTAEDAAREVGCDVAQIAKSLVFEAGGDPVLFIVSGANRVDLAAAARALGVDEVRRADANVAKEATGYSIGATPPFGHRRPLRVLMDEDLLQHTEVWAAGGRPDTVFAVDPHRLAAAAGADVCDLKERSDQAR